MRRLLHLVFFLSGFTALVYQVAWVAILKVDFGTTVHAVSTALTIFMGGLALGSAWVGRLVDRGARPLLVYGALELALGLWAAVFALSIDALHALAARMLEGTALSLGATAPIKLLLTAVVLLPPATLMGGTLPALAKAVADAPTLRGARLAWLYGVNTLGAVAGCLVEAFVLVPWTGVRTSILIAAAVNLALGAIALALARRGTATDPLGEARRRPADSAVGDDVTPSAAPLRLIAVLAFLSGFITLATEILWTRLLINLVTGNVLVFAALLAGFLLGLGAGSLLVARWADRLAAAGRLERAVAWWLLACAAGVAASVLCEGALAAVFDRVIRPEEGGWPPGRALRALGLVLLVVALPATAFGTILPLLFRWGSRSLATLGRDVGRLYALNTVGAIVGSLAAGFVIVEHVGVRAGLLALAGLYALMAALATLGSASRPRVARIAALALAGASIAALATPALRAPRYWLNGGFMAVKEVPASATEFLAEDVEGTVGVMRHRDVLSLSVNGVIVAQDTREDLWDLLLKAHLPMLLHEDPRKVALVGLGAGVSAGAVLAYDVERVDVAEIAAQVEPAHRWFGAVNGRCWEDPRLRLVINDGRHVLATTTERYDVISVDPTDPPVVYQYSRDFFQVCHDRLAPGGLMVQWLPMFRLSSLHLRVVMRSFAQVFEHSSVWYDGTSVLLVGSRDRPLVVVPERVRERLQRASVRESLRPIGSPDAELILATRVCGPQGLRRMIGADVPENSDDRPWLESTILMSAPMLVGPSFADNLALLLAEWDEPGAPPSTRRPLMRDLLVARIARLRENDSLDRLRERALALIHRYQISEPDWASLEAFLY